MIRPGGESLTTRAGWVGAGRVATVVCVMGMAIAFSRMLEPERYGAFQAAWIVVTVIGTVFAGGLPLAGLTFAAKTRRAGWRLLWRRMTVLHALSALLAGCVLVAFVPVLRSWSASAGADAVALLPHLVVMVAVSFYESHLVVSGRSKRYARVSWATWTVAAVAAPLAVALGASVPVALAAFSCGALVRLVFAARDLSRVPAPEGGFNDPPAYRDVLVFAVPVSVSVLVGTLARWVDKAVVVSWFSPENFAVYVNGAIELPFLGLVLGAVTSALLPEYSRLHHVEDYASFAALWSKSARLLAALLFPLATLGVALSAPLVIAVFGGHYWASRWGLRIFLLLVPLRIAAYEPVLLAAGKMRLVMWGAVGDLVAIAVFAQLLIPVFGMWGAAVGAVASTYLQVSVYLFFLRRVFGVPFSRLLPWNDLVRNGVAALIAGAIAYGTQKAVGGLWTAVAAGTLVFVPAYLLLARAGFVRKDVRDHVRRALRFGR